MTEQQQQIEPVGAAFERPACDPPHPENLALAFKLCTALLPMREDTETTVKHFPSGWSSNDVIQVSLLSPSHQRRFIVKLPRRQTSSCVAGGCEAEALRICWAAKHGLGPKVLAFEEESGGFVMEFIEGQTLTTEMIMQCLPLAVNMLRQIHEAEAMKWMRKYDPMEIVRQHMESVKQCNAMPPEDVRFVEGIIRDTEQKVKDHPWVPCHNDFHSHNVMLGRAGSRYPERLLAIDFEDCDLGDPM